MGAKRVINAGDIFERLTILAESDPQHYFKKDGRSYTKRVFTVVCSCGQSEKFDTQLNHLVSGKTLSCGCYRKELIDKRGLEFRWIHGMCGTKTYKTYQAMKRRCTDKTFHDWDLYGGAGVIVCDEWAESFENFLKDMGERPIDCTLNRVKGSKVYSKETCEWATLSVQSYDTKKRSTNTSGRTGVGYYNNKWVASIGFQNKAIRLGSFETKEAAVLARETAERELYGFTKD